MANNKTKSSKRTSTKAAKRKQMLAASTAVAFLTIMIGSFVSAELALLTAGLLGVWFFSVQEHKRRTQWEKSIHEKLHALTDNVEHIARETSRNKGDVFDLKEGITQTGNALRNHNFDPRSGYDTLTFLATRLEDIGMKPRSSALTKSSNFEALVPKPQTKKIANDKDTSLFSALKERAHVKTKLRGAMENSAINMFIQPIMQIPQRRVRFYEIFARLKMDESTYLPAARYMDIADKEAMTGDIDGMLLIQALDTIKEMKKTESAVPFFINVTDETLKNKKFMAQMHRFLTQNKELAPFLIFEIQQSNFDKMGQRTLKTLDMLTQLGCRVSIDHITHLKFDITQMRNLNVRFIKMDAELLLSYTQSQSGVEEITLAKRTLGQNDIQIIASKIESDYALKELLDFDLQFAQGYLLGKPKLSARIDTSAPSKIKVA